jgi:non-ribosomal peptide synthetase component F
MISRAALDNLAAVTALGLGDAPGDSLLQLISPGFDASLMEIVAALSAGRALHIAPPARPGPSTSRR